MKNKFILLIIAIVFFASGVAFAGSTAMPVVLGLLYTSGCPTGSTSCWLPASSANPIPAALAITP